MALVYIRPDADSVDGSWTNASGNNTDLYDSLNETSASDSDYIRSSNNPANDIVKLRLGNFASAVIEPMTVRFRYKKVVSAAETLSMKVRLLQASTTIAEWEYPDVSDTYVDGEEVLTSLQFDEISDFTDLYLEFEAVSGVFEVVGAMLLLTDEDEGYAIDATTYDTITEADYVGGPVGGTVAVIDTGTPANNLTNVALDSSNLTQAGTSPKMVNFNSSPYVRWTPHNLALDSQTLTSANWTATSTTVTSNTTAAPDGTTTADTITAPFSGAFRFAGDAAISFTGGFYYTCSVYLKYNNNNWIGLWVSSGGASDAKSWFNVNTGAAGSTATGGGATVLGNSITSVGSGWYRCSITFTTTSDVSWFPLILIADSDGGQNAANNGDAVYAWGVQVVRGYNVNPYLVTTTAARIGIPQAYDAYEDCFGVLVEPAATNLIFASIPSAGSWNVSGSTLTANDTTSPDGAVKGDKLTGDGGNNEHYTYKNVTSLGSGTTYTLSVYAKKGTNNFVALTVNASGGPTQNVNAVFDLNVGVTGETHSGAGGGTIIGSTIQAVGNDWYRCSLTYSLTDTSHWIFPGLAQAATGNTWISTGAVTFTSSATVYLWGAQLETGTVATSYIPTISATATRAADNVSALTSTLAWDNTKMTVYADVKTFSDSTAFLWQAYQGGGERLGVYGTGSQFQTYNLTSSAQDVTINVTPPGTYLDTRHQVTSCYQDNDFDSSVDGGAVGTDDTGDMTLVATDLHIGSQGGTSDINGFIYRLIHVPRQVETDG